MIRKNGMILNRETLRIMLQAALDNAEHRFARQLALAWLSAFPGDLEVSLLQARAILAEGRPGLVVAALDLVVRKDPEYLEAYQILAAATRQADPARCALATTHTYVLGAAAGDAGLPGWGDTLRAALQAVNSEQWPAAERLVPEALRACPDSLLAAVAHLKLSRAMQAAATTLQLAQLYQGRWPDCLPINLMLAEARMELGQEPEAVRLLHQCVANDAAGQVVRRLWGEDHPYRSLWLDEMVIAFDQPIPAGVAARLGWNQLNAGDVLPAPDLRVPVEPVNVLPELEEIMAPAGAAADCAAPEPEPIADLAESLIGLDAQQPLQPIADDGAAEGDATSQPAAPKPGRPANGRSGTASALHQVESEFDRLARKLRKTGISQSDGRFPVYVIFTTRTGLTNQYGPQTTAIIDADLRRLAGAVRQRAGWDALVFYPDDPSCAGQFGLEPVMEQDPWKLKLALMDLDKALARRGEMIGALLIVGGDEVVPFHRLPNPTDDSDREVPSDNPYGTRDSNYFVTEWPVGRLPTEPGPDAGSLLAKLRSLQLFHARSAGKGSLRLPGFGWLAGFWNRIRGKQSPLSLGYTAAVWRRSSLAVFRPIGAPHIVLASPPECSGVVNPQRVTRANLGYYNLHGTEDSSAWYGQRDPAEPGEGPDYPVALLPEDLQSKGPVPQVVFSEACYGGHIFGKTDSQSLVLKFLAVGTQAVVASTCVSYGSISTPLIAADLLGNLFWQHLKSGRTVGDALSQARLDLTREMNRRQGYLDSEDQKTLISFVLYGDPLASYNGFRLHSKSIRRRKDHPMPKTVCDRLPAGEQPPAIPHAVLKQVKALVAAYLPGAELGDVHLSRQHGSCAGKNHHCPTAELGSRMKSMPESGRLVVTMSKQITVAQHLHRHYIRVTLDEGGHPVKLAISR